MSHPLRKSFASLVLVSVLCLQFAPLTIHADDAVQSADSGAVTPDPSPAPDTGTAADTGTSADQQPADTAQAASTDASTNTTAYQSTDQSADQSQTPTEQSASDTSSNAAGQQASTTDDQQTDQTSTDTTGTQTQGAVVSAPTSDPSADQSSQSSSANDSSSSSNATSSTSDSLDATSTGSSQSEEHDNLDVHATSTDPAFSINGVLDQINDIASTSQSGPVSDPTGSGGGTVAGTTTDTPAFDLNPVLDATSSNNATSTGDASPTLPTLSSTTPTIVSGAATAIANILNILNSTFVNSQGAILFQNFADQAGNIDFRNPLLFLGLCGTTTCSGSTGLQINLLNDGTINNDVFISANSGQNDLQSNTDGAILSGNALAGLNLINLANVTVANSNYLLIALNAFRGVNGDIVFPALADFFAPLLGADSAAQVAGLNNGATVENDVTTGANSGDNTVTTGPNGTSTVLTGSAGAHTNVFNQINSLLAGSGLSILFRISGDWSGEVQGLPDGVSWVRTPEGLLITGNATGTDALSPLTTISGTSSAGIVNHAQVGALSGANDVNASTTALISTGDALAGANIINIANQTVIGRNWILAIINIFGDFTGNIAFGRPDLWVGAQAQAPGTINPGDVISYKITVINNGDAEATQSKLKETIDAARESIIDASLPFTMNGAIATFDLGSLAPGAAKEVTFRARVTNFSAGDAIVSQSDALLHENDNNPTDNTDSTTVQNVSIGGGGGGGFGYGYNPLPPVSPAAAATSSANSAVAATVFVTRTSSTITVQTASTTATETIIVSNTSNVTARGVKLNDIIRDDQGADVHEEFFDIGDLAPHEEVSISYDITFHEMGRGRYTLWAEIGGENVAPQIYQNGDITFLAPVTPTPVFTPVSNTISEEPLSDTIRPLAAHVRAPLVPNTGTWTDSVEAIAPNTGNPSQTAAAGAVDGSVSDTYVKLVSFGLLLLSIFGALRAFVFRPF